MIYLQFLRSSTNPSQTHAKSSKPKQHNTSASHHTKPHVLNPLPPGSPLLLPSSAFGGGANSSGGARHPYSPRTLASSEAKSRDTKAAGGGVFPNVMIDKKSSSAASTGRFPDVLPFKDKGQSYLV